MRVLTVNAGSSSLKLALVEDGARTADQTISARGEQLETAALLQFAEPGFDCSSHRIVHGGKRFTSATLVDAEVREALDGLVDLAPLHTKLALKAMDALGSNPHDGAKVVAKMKELPTDDPLFGKGPLRADGRRLIPAYLFEVKKPEESKGPWDYYKLVATIAPEDAAKPLEASDCPLVKK